MDEVRVLERCHYGEKGLQQRASAVEAVAASGMKCGDRAIEEDREAFRGFSTGAANTVSAAGTLAV